MFSGKDAVNPAYPTQWALNPVAYQNVDSSQVDWAALAQQWIAMKEAAAIVGDPQDSKVEAEEGEAPMEVENSEVNSESPMPPGTEWNSTTNSWGAPAWNQWGWGWSGPGPVDSKIPPDQSIAMPPLIDGYPMPDVPPMPGYTTGPMAAPTFQHGYWTAPQAEPPDGRDAMRGRDTRRSKSRNCEAKTNRTRPPREKIPVMPPVIEPIVMPPVIVTPTIDAAKRRQLPAWIREGLEKMEREKQKAIEREQEKKALEEAEKEKKRIEEEELARLKAEASGEPMMPAKSKFDSDSEGEEKSTKVEKVKQIESNEHPEAQPSKEESEEKPPPAKSKEEIMQEVMLAVRRSLTEILLEVTDHEIQLVSQEELARFNFHQASHLNAMKASKSKALSAITSGLGLGAYESSSESETEDPDDLSDQQLMEVIRRKRADFERTAREIEAEVRRAGSEPAPATPERAPPADRSSTTPPPLPAVESDTPEKKFERRPSKDKKSNHKSTDRVDCVKKLENNDDKRDTKKTSRYERTPSPPKTPDRLNKNNSNSGSSDSEEDSKSTSSDKFSSDGQEKAKLDRLKKRKRRSSSSSDSPKKTKNKKQAKEKIQKVEEKNSHSKPKRHDDYGKTEKSKSKRKDDYSYEKRKSSRSRDYERSQRDKHREGSAEDRPKKRSRRSRSISYESRSGRRRSRDRSEERHHRRERRSYDRESSKRDRSHDRRDYDRRDHDRNDKYVRVRDYERRRSRSNSRSRHRR